MEFAKQFIDRKGELEKIHAQVIAANKDYSDLEAKMKDFSARKEELDKLSAQLGSFTKDISTMLEKKSDIEKLAAQALAARKAYESLAVEMKDFSARREEVARTGAQLQAMTKDFGSLGNDFDGKMHSLEAGIADLDALDKERARMSAEASAISDGLVSKSKEVTSSLKDTEKMLAKAESDVLNVIEAVKKAEPKLAEMRAVKKELVAANIIAAENVSKLDQADSTARSVTERIAVLEREEAGLHSDVEKFGEGLKRTAVALSTVRQEFDVRVQDLNRLLSGSEDELEKLTSELGMSAERADELVKGFESRIGRMKAVEAQLSSLQAQKETLSTDIFSIIKGLESLESPRKAIPLAELSRKLAETKRKLVEVSEKAETQKKGQAQAKASLSDILNSE
ncbi:Chromosome partition protein Smc [uncultured archaeon]|nr:Chromosome partition protein Smc [uncultured archaeon]